MSLVVLVAGWVATHAAGALGRQTGLGSAFLGGTLLAAATSMPELSTTIAAARSRRYTVSVSNVFGNNTFDLALLFLADVLYRDGPVLAAAGASTIFLAALGAILTGLFTGGLLERANRMILGMGIDSVLLILTYVGGVAALARLG